MTTIAPTTAASFFEQAFEKIATFAREQQRRRAQRIALAALMEMDASRLDDIGIDAQDVADAVTAVHATGILENRRTAPARAWTADQAEFAR